MRILAISDTHGHEYFIPRIMDNHPEAETIFFLGDGLRGAIEIAEQNGKSWHFVRGNNDYGMIIDGDGCQIADSGMEIVRNRRVFYTHGHIYSVKTDLERVINAARERGADLLLFGHTHRPMVDYKDGLHIMNPGSLKYSGTYGIIDIISSGIAAHTARIPS